MKPTTRLLQTLKAYANPEKVIDNTNRERMLKFCPSCFASDESGSWNHVVEGTHCYNCGNSGGIIPVPAWAVDEIRRTASWVGKRYYPDKEDIERADELTRLRALIKEFPGRTARPASYDCQSVYGSTELWEVEQRTPTGSIMCLIGAPHTSDPLEVMKKVSLPYYTEEALNEKPKG